MRWFGIALLCGLSGAIGWAMRPEPTHDSTTSASRESERQTLVFAGGVVEGARPEIVVRPEVAGRIKEVAVREGQEVKQGDLLATLESDLAESRLREAKALLSVAQAQRRRLVASHLTPPLERRPAVKFAPVPRDESDAAGVRPVSGKARSPRDSEPSHPPGKTAASHSIHEPRGASLGTEIQPAPPLPDPEEIAIADAQIAQAEAVVLRESLLKDRHALRSPIDGIMARVDAQPGELVDPAERRERWVVVDPSRLRVRAYVEELDAMKVVSGQSALIAAVGRPQQRELGTVVECAVMLRPKSSLHHKPGERIDVRVREIVIQLHSGSELPLGLPVEVFLQPRR